MKILMLTRSLPVHRLGGMEAVAWDLAKELKQQGCDVTILTTACVVLSTESIVDGVNIICINCPSGRYSLSWWRGSRRFVEANEGEFDVIFSVSAAGLSLKQRIDGVPWVVQVHGTAWTEIKSKFNEGSLVGKLKILKNMFWMIGDFRYRKFDCFVAVGPIILNDLLHCPTKWLTGDGPKMTISNGISELEFKFDVEERYRIRRAFEIDEDCKVVICVSRLNKQKGVYEALTAFALALEMNSKLRLIVVGDGPELDNLVEVASKFGLSELIHFTGKLPRKDLYSYYSAADVFLFNTKRIEGLPTNVLEAKANGLPLILSKHIENRQLGAALVDPLDKEEIAKAIIATDIDIARESALPAEFSLEFSARKYIELFHDLSSRVKQ